MFKSSYKKHYYAARTAFDALDERVKRAFIDALLEENKRDAEILPCLWLQRALCGGIL